MTPAHLVLEVGFKKTSWERAGAAAGTQLQLFVRKNQDAGAAGLFSAVADFDGKQDWVLRETSHSKLHQPDLCSEC